MKLRNVTRDPLTLNIRGGEFRIDAKTEKTIDCQLELLEENEVQAAIARGQLMVFNEIETKPAKKEETVKKEKSESETGKKKGSRFGRKKTDDMEE